MDSSTRRAHALNEAVTGEIRAHLGRRRWKASELARKLGENEMWLSRRLRGSQPMTLSDIERICAALQVSPADLIASAVRMASQTTVPKVPVPDRPADGRPKRRGDRNGPMRRPSDLSRPKWTSDRSAVATTSSAA